MTWAIYNKDVGKINRTIVREDTDKLPPGYFFVREATEAEVMGELDHRKREAALGEDARAYRHRPDVATANLVAHLIEFDNPDTDYVGNIPPKEWETILAKLRAG